MEKQGMGKKSLSSKSSFTNCLKMKYRKIFIVLKRRGCFMEIGEKLIKKREIRRNMLGHEEYISLVS
jgi:hypothetical protein